MKGVSEMQDVIGKQRLYKVLIRIHDFILILNALMLIVISNSLETVNHIVFILFGIVLILGCVISMMFKMKEPYE